MFNFLCVFESLFRLLNYSTIIFITISREIFSKTKQTFKNDIFCCFQFSVTICTWNNMFISKIHKMIHLYYLLDIELHVIYIAWWLVSSTLSVITSHMKKQGRHPIGLEPTIPRLRSRYLNHQNIISSFYISK